MIKIKRLKQNSETIYPITHENAVYDSNGIAISDKYMTKTEIPTSLPANGGNSATVGGFSIWSGTQSQYDALSSKSNTTIYLIKEV